MTFIKPTQIRQFAPLFRSFTPRIALRAMSAEVGPKVNSNTEPAPTTPLLNRSSQKTNFKDLLQNIGLLTFGAGSLAAASYFTSQKEDETLSFNRADLYPYLKPTQSPTEERLQAILKPWNKATATEEIFLLSEKILHDLHTAICQMTFAPSPIQLKEMPNPSMDGIPDALKTKMENSFKAQMTNRSNIEENLSKSYFKGPTAELDFALHVIHFKISVEYSTPYMKGEIPSGTITPQIARDIYENDGSYMLQAYYAYLNCKDRIRQNKEQGETGFEFKNMNLTALPPEIEQIPGLTILDLRANNISYLPPQIRNLTDLDYLNLSDNNLKSLPAEIGQLTKLTDLSLERNQLKGLPPEFSKLQSLDYLNLDFNDFTSLPRELLSLKKLYTLHIHGYLTKGQSVSFNDFTFWEKVMLERIRSKTPRCHIYRDDQYRPNVMPSRPEIEAERAKQGLISAIASVLK